ncbi:MAG: DUF3575 domain-containing protein [Bacteroidales bacterium]|nr:DUF3575 domain-containing protein [Bacteroidales bacterium]MBD5289047.1 DUF3575 domain-containing protein [Bacteroides sp.]MBD5387198.1 DUF3575 domain-containing protein [bacterium]MDE6256329.1 DUF3575 domain-containing protein [Muribaculaceae bacterium]
MRRPTLIVMLMAVISLLLPREARAGDDIALKTNLLYDAGLNPSLGIEFGLAPKWSMDISGQVNNWTVSGKRWRHWAVQPEARFWLCERFQGHFFGLHALGGQFNVGNVNDNLKYIFLGLDDLSTKRYQGWMAGAGIAYGYAWVLNKHWNIEAEIGAGWIYSKSDVYPCKDCGSKIQEGFTKNYIGLTKAAVNLVYIF